MRRKPQDCVRLYATGPLIRTLMALSGISINQLAKTVSVSPATAHAFVTGRVVDTSPELADKYAAALQVKRDLLFVPMRTTLSMEELAA